eukprot:gene465-1108_t
MARLYIDKNDIASRTAWFYVLMTKAQVEIFEFNKENDEMFFDNPLQIRPLLVDGNVRVWGSQAVILYVAEKFTNFEGFGATLQTRLKNESILYWASGSLYRSVVTEFVAPQLYAEEALLGDGKAAQLEFGEMATREQLDSLEMKYFMKTKFISGESPDFIDFYVGIYLSVIDKVEFDLSKWPKTCKWYNEIKQRTNEMIKTFQEQETFKQG